VIDHIQRDPAADPPKVFNDGQSKHDGNCPEFAQREFGLCLISCYKAAEVIRIDPAVASGAFVTTVTDVVGFFAFLGLASLWFGLGYQSVVFVIAISVIFIVLINTLAAALAIDRDLVKAALTLGAGRWTLFHKVVVPNALPGILLGLRIALAGAWGGVLVAEMIATQQGLGYMILRAQAAFRPDLVIGGMLVVGLVGCLLNLVFVRLQRRLVHV